ncbi:MAG: hypothetical protein ABIP94_22225 [Planctomycetota bacterium]
MRVGRRHDLPDPSTRPDPSRPLLAAARIGRLRAAERRSAWRLAPGPAAEWSRVGPGLPHDPNGYAAIFASQELATLTIAGLHAQTQWLVGGGILNLGVVFADGQGQANPSWTIPAGTRLIDQPLWFQGLTGFALPLQLSPVAGGVIR